MIYPDSFEKKIGFAAVRDMVASHCSSTLGGEYCREMAFSKNVFIQYSKRYTMYQNAKIVQIACNNKNKVKKEVRF